MQGARLRLRGFEVKPIREARGSESEDCKIERLRV